MWIEGDCEFCVIIKTLLTGLSLTYVQLNAIVPELILDLLCMRDA